LSAINSRGGKCMKRHYKTLSFLLVMILVLGVSVPLMSTAEALASSGQGTAMDALGFDTNARPDDCSEPASIADTPYGRDNVLINPVKEKYIIDDGNGILTGHNDNTHQTNIEAELTGSIEYLAIRSASGNLYGQNKDNFVATVALTWDDTESVPQFDLLITNPLTGATSSYLLYRGPAGQGDGGEDLKSYRDTDSAYKLQNFLAITTGDFDGDGNDEIAVFIPAAVTAGGPRVEVWQRNATSWSNVKSFPLICGDSIANMVDLLAADINGDGIDDLCFSENIYLRRLENWYELKVGINSPSLITVCYGDRDNPLTDTQRIQVSPSTGNTTHITRLSLDFGDIDGDGRKELVTAGQEEDCEGTRWFGYFQFNHQTGEVEMVDDTTITIGSYDLDGQNYSYFSTAGLKTNMALVRAVGRKAYIYCDSILYEYTPSGFTVYMRFEGSTFTYGDEIAKDASGAWWGALGVKWTDIKSDGGNYYFHEWGAVAADFNGDGVETILLRQYFWMDVHVNELNPYKDSAKNETSLVLDNPVYRLTEINPLQAESRGDSSEGSNSFTVADPQAVRNYLGTGYHSFSFAAPNTDDDTVLLRYKEYDFTYSSPIVLAVLASPPYYCDLMHLDGGETYVYGSQTSFGKSQGSGGAVTQTNTVSVGGMIGFEYDWNVFGTKVVGIDVEAEFQHDWTWETTQSKTVTYSVTYTTFGGQDSVVLYAIPTDIFTYDAWIPNEDGTGGTWSEMAVQLPYQPVTSVVELSVYDSIARQYPDVLPVIGGNILRHKLGQPATYPQSVRGLAEVLTGSEWSGVSGGAGAAITQSIEITEENTQETSYNNAWQLTVGGSVLAFKFNVMAGGEAGGAESTTDIEGTSFETTVVNMPQEGWLAGYGYRWKLLKYSYRGLQEFPVITYLVGDVRQPPLLPAHITARGISTGAIRLNWEESKTINGNSDDTINYYGIYRYYDTSISPGWREIARIPSIQSGNYTYNAGSGVYTATQGGYTFTYDEVAGEYGFVNSGLSPYTVYSYRINVTRFGLSPYQSVYCEVCQGRTLSSLGSITITGPTDVQFYPDDQAAELSLLVGINLNQNVEQGETLYQWQKRAQGTRGAGGEWISPAVEWESIYNAWSTNYRINNPVQDDVGDYRLIADVAVSSGGGGQWIGAVSDTVSLAMAKRTPALEVTAINTGHDMVKIRLDAVVDKGAGIRQPAGTVAFEITGNRFSRYHVQQVDGNARANVENIELPASGVYTIRAVYSGDEVYDSVVSVTDFLAFYPGDDFHYIDMDSSVEYGCTLTPGVWRVTAGGEQVPVAGAIFTVENQAGWVTGDTVVAWAVGEFTLNAAFDGKTLSRGFQVTPRAITASVQDVIAEQGNASHPGSDVIEFSHALAFNDTAASLGLSVQYLNYAGAIVPEINATTPAGEYTIRIVTDYAFAAAQQNYRFSFSDGCYTILPSTAFYTVSYGVTDNTGGSLSARSEDGAFSSGQELRGGTPLVFTAAPDDNFMVSSWNVRVGGVVQEQFSSHLADTLSIPALWGDTEVMVSFEPLQTFTVAGTVEGSGGRITIVSANPEMIGGKVRLGGSVTFQILPDTNFRIQRVWRDDTGEEVTSQVSAGIYVLRNITTDVTIKVRFASLGGESGGGGGIAGPPPVKLTIPVSSDSTTVQAAYTLKDSKVIISLDDGFMEELLRSNAKTVITIDLTGIQGCNGVELELDGKWLAANKKITALVVKGLGEISIRREMLLNLGVKENSRVLIKIGLGSISISLEINNISIKDCDPLHPIRVVYPYDKPVNNATVIYNRTTGGILPYCLADGKTGITFLTPCFGSFDVKDNAKRFSDVQRHWAAHDIAFITARGLFVGTGADRFSPDMSMTRGMFVTVLGRLMGVSDKDYHGTSFTDVSPEQWYSPYVQWAVKNNIVSGYGNQLFGPEDKITREQMAVIIMRFAEYAGITLNEGSGGAVFDDQASISHWAASHVSAAQRAGLIAGRSSKHSNCKA
jgi:hypothetical protein